MKFTEERIRLFAAPLSDTENEKCKHAIGEIRKALKGLNYTDDGKEIGTLVPDTSAYSISMRSTLNSERVTIFIQGSYANNTCVRGDSDVDIAIVREDTTEYTQGQSFLTNNSKIIEAKAFKNAVERALKYYFYGDIQRKNKSILVKGNTYRKQADAVPCMSTRHASTTYSSYDKYGVVIYADDGSIIYNFPKHHIENGKTKNKNTNYYYKKMVRVIKKMRHLMSDSGYSSANNVSSFGLESLLWNIPDYVFTKYTTYKYEFGEIVSYLYQNTNSFAGYKEANGIKALCPTGYDVNKYASFVRDLYSFYDYDI